LNNAAPFIVMGHGEEKAAALKAVLEGRIRPEATTSAQIISA